MNSSKKNIASRKRVMTTTPLGWYGGKSGLAPHLVKLLAPHKTYVEVCGGGAALLFQKTPSLNEVYNDLDADLVNFFRVLRGQDGDRLIRQLTLTPHARDEHACCRRDYSTIVDPLERARCFFVLVRQSYSAQFNGSYSSSSTKRQASVFKNKVDALPEAVNRLREVQVENLDFRKLIPKYDRPNTVMYVDPPYLPETRPSMGTNKYAHEMTTDDHLDLLALVVEARSKIMLSGHDSELYRSRLHGWNKWQKRVQCVSAGRKGESVWRLETVWMNYTPPTINSGDDDQDIFP